MGIRTLLGMETEYAVSGLACNGVPVDRNVLVQALLKVARKAYPHLRDASSGGLFLTNGARLYIDRGAHPEYATPECESPWEVLHAVRAGEELLLDLAKRVCAEDPDLHEVNVFRCNVDYSRSGATWGCHESYLYRQNPAQLPAQLVPFLVSRQIYAGAGGFNPISPGLEFTLSPRAWLLPNERSSDSTCNRGIFHLKEESLSGPGWHRLHLICGESLCSETATLLKLGATALVLAAIEVGSRPGDAIRLASPVEALRTIAAGLDRRVGIALADGGRLSAAEIQRNYLAEVERCRQERLLPEWADGICALWRQTLDSLEAGADALAGTLDWVIKRTLYQRWARNRMSWDRLPHWGDVLKRLERAAGRMLRQEGPIDGAALLNDSSPFRSEIHRLTPLLAAEGIEWPDFHAYRQLRHQLLEADVRFGQLGAAGIFEQLDRSGVLSHRTGGPCELPTSGRARLRGEWVRRLSARGDTHRYRCDWDQLCDELTGRRLDLSDPFVSTAEWS